MSLGELGDVSISPSAISDEHLARLFKEAQAQAEAFQVYPYDFEKRIHLSAIFGLETTTADLGPFLKAGDGREDWWTYKHMVKQLTDDAIPLFFERLHPGCVAVFLFDNSSNHGAFADDALVATRMTLKEKPWDHTTRLGI